MEMSNAGLGSIGMGVKMCSDSLSKCKRAIEDPEWLCAGSTEVKGRVNFQQERWRHAIR